jgi:uncharacterized protein (TIRG00374 family)
MDEKNNGFTKILNYGFFVLVFLGLIFIFYKNRGHLYDYKENLLNANYAIIFVVLLYTMVAIFFRSWRWYYILLPIKEKLSLLNLYRVSINGLAADFTMPAKLGLPLRAILLKKCENINVESSVPSILGDLVVEHTSEFLIAMVCVFIGGHLSKIYHTFGQIFSQHGFIYNLGISFSMVLMLGIAGFMFRKKLTSIGFLNKLIETVNITRKRVDYLSYSYIISIVNLIFSFVVFWMLIATLGHPEVPFTFVVVAGTITNFMALISPIPGGLGVKEITIYGLYDFYYGLGGFAFIAILLMRLITYLALFLSFLIERIYTGIEARKKLAVIEEKE